MRWNIIGIFVTSILVISTAFSILQMYNLGDGALPFYSTINITLDLVGMGVCIILLLTTVFDHRSNMATMYFMAMILFEGFILLWDFEFWINNGDPDRILWNKLVNYYLLGFIHLLLAAFWLYIGEIISNKTKAYEILQIIYYAILAVGLLLILTNPWTDAIFIVDDTGTYVRQDYYWFTLLTPGLMLVVAMIAVLKYVDVSEKKLALCSYTILPIFAAIIQSLFFGIGLIYIALLFSIMLIYGNFYVERGRDIAEKQAEIVEQDVTLLTAQIQPYFLYRSLKAISEIDGTPPETVKALTEFNRDRRGNMNSFSQKNPIPFKEEMRHVDT
ncbi:MAG: histidine kinase [archaeon]|nr:histidine kinase [archaeon]